MSFITRCGFALIGLFIIIGAVAPSQQSVSADEAPKGAVVVARLSPTALLIWDASATVGDLVVAQATSDAAMRALEVDAIRILAQRAPTLHAAQVEIHVQYAPTGVVGAAYNASTFANQTPLVVLSAERIHIAARANAWASDVGRGRTPSDLTIRVTGQFPHAQ